MTHAHGGLLVTLVALALGAVAGNVLVAALLRTCRARLARLSPVEKTRVALLGLALPAVLSATTVAVVLAQPALALRFPALDHCTAHVGAPHVCFVHGTLAFLSPWELGGVALLLGALVVALAREAVRVWRGHRAAAALAPVAADGGVTWTDDPQASAFVLGLVRPRVVATAGLRAALAPAHLEAALAHERAHVRHRDALVRVAGRIASFLLVAPLRRALSDLLIAGQEERADLAAADAVGSAALVAEALLTLYRAGAGATPADAPALAARGLEHRVRALCEGHGTERLADRLGAALVVLCLALAGAHAPVHHTAEEVAGALLSAPVHTHAAHAPSHLTPQD